MSETPRSGKRRRLDAATQNSPTPKSGHASARKSRRAVVDELDLYDDIDGALTVGSASRTKRGGGDDADTPMTSGKKRRKGGKIEDGQPTTPSRSQRQAKGSARDEMGARSQEPVYFSSLPGLRPKDVPTPKSSRRRNGFETVDSVDDLDAVGDSNDLMNGDETDGEDTASNAAQQLRAETAAAVETPTKRKKNARGRISQQDDHDIEMREDQMEHTPRTNGTSPKKARKQSTRATGMDELLPEEDPFSARKKRQYKRKTQAVKEDEDPMDMDEITNGHSGLDTKAPPATLASTSDIKAIPEELSQGLTLLKLVALSKLSSRRPIPLANLTSEYNKVHTLLSATVQSGESNSMLLIGARGSGKSTLINTALQDISRSSKDHFHTVRLNGFVQTDDKLALREIWRQLGREMEIDDDGENGPGKSYADTLTMLLALLSHPDEISGRTGGAENQVAKSVIFIMDEFDLFATHPRQTLLYNLLDIAQSRKAPIAVLGLTTRIDVTEALEKRVKSRFSHRYVHLPLPKGLGQFTEVGKAALIIKAEEMSVEENAILSKKGGTLDEWNKAVDVGESFPFLQLLSFYQFRS
jgi:origin recognition complex subunit 4